MSLDPKERRQEKEAADAAARQPPRLNPKFPFVKTRFDPFAFGLEAQPPELDKPPGS